MTTISKHRILITVEGGVIQCINNIPRNTVIEVRDFDGDREHPTWSEEHQAFVGEWEGEQTEDRAAPYHYQRSTDGIDDTFDIIQPDGERLVSVYFWDDGKAAEAKARLITDALNAFSPSNTAT